MSGPLKTIAPYQREGRWVFDDEAAGLVAEPLAAEAEPLLGALARNINDAESGFNLLIAEIRFPGHQQKLVKIAADGAEDGPWQYECRHLGVKGSLCPALSRLYDTPPEKIYVSATPKWRVVRRDS